MGDVNLIGVRLQVLILHRHGSERRVVTGIPRAWHGEDESTALGAIGTGLAVACTGIAGVGDGRGGADIVCHLSIVVGHEVDLDVTLRGVGPVDLDLCAGLPVDGALVEVARRVVENERRIRVLVLPRLEMLQRRCSTEGGCGEKSGHSKNLCNRSHLGI